MKIKRFKEKDSIIKKIGIEYRKANLLELEINCVNEEESVYLENDKKEKYYENVRKKVDYIFLQLDDQLSKIIYNDYFTLKKDNWWIFFYSKSTYYRLKNKAMDIFLEWWYA